MKEWTEIYEQMRGTFAQRAGFVPSEGCDSAVRLYALAAELQSLLMQADWVLDQSFPQTAQGMYLDYHAETRGITRGAADWSAEAREWAEKNGLIVGDGNGNKQYRSFVTREQLAVFLKRLRELEK